MWGLTSFHSVISEITRVPGSPDSVFKKVPILEKLNPDMDYVACEEEQLSQFNSNHVGAIVTESYNNMNDYFQPPPPASSQYHRRKF